MGPAHVNSGLTKEVVACLTSAPVCGYLPLVAAVEDEIDELLDEAADDVDLRLARLEKLLDEMPLLLSSVVLRQNPHNVHEWHKRARVR